MRLSALSTVLIILPVLMFFNSNSYAATEIDCSFRTMVTTDDYSFNVTSQPAESCENQVLRISVLKQAMPYTQFVTPVATIAEKAWAEDLDDDGNFELLVLSHKNFEPAKKVLEIFTVDGNILKQLRLPESDQTSGYRGGDRFIMENGRIVRSYPLYLSGDADGKPKGGEGTVLYQYRNRELILVAGKEKAKSVAQPAAKESIKKKGALSVKLQSIEVKPDYIEIKADGAIENFKTIRIADPWRLIIDIPGVYNNMPAKEVVIDRHGISRIRIGTHKDLIRLVFDSAVSPLPIETVTQAENAIRVGFYQTLKK